MFCRPRRSPTHFWHTFGTDTSQIGGYRRDVDEATSAVATRVLERLERIESLGRSGPPPSCLLGELRALVAEAEAWARLEGDRRACSAVTKLREEAEGMI
jgi:hypothetical protein